MKRQIAVMLALLGCLAPCVAAAEFKLDKNEDGVTVYVDGQLFTRYLVKSGAKPILWPILGPTGKEMTRGYPMRKVGKWEKADHVHHRSLWFDHGDVNGVSFWDERGNHGNIVHREYLQLADGDRAVIKTRNDWVGPAGKVFCQDVRSYSFGADTQQRWIDFDVTVTATHGRAVFGDTKEGSFGIRVAGSMRVELNKGGTIINSAGQKNKDAWGKPASWVDYYGPVDGETLGIAILNHPSSFRYPTYWHVRTYGLFAANPFGLHNFLGTTEKKGQLTLDPNTSFSLHYRVILHRGDEKSAGIAEAFRRYAAEKPGE